MVVTGDSGGGDFGGNYGGGGDSGDTSLLPIHAKWCRADGCRKSIRSPSTPPALDLGTTKHRLIRMNEPATTEIIDRVATSVQDRIRATRNPEFVLERGWVTIESLPDGQARAIMQIPVGRGYWAPLHSAPFKADGSDDTAIERFATDLVAALPNVRAGARALTRFMLSVSHAAWTVRTAGRAEGRSLGGEIPTLAPIPASRIAGPNWKAAVQEARAVLHVSGFAADLGIERHAIEVGRPAEVDAALAPLLDLQPERSRRFHLARAPGPRLLVDSVTVDLLLAGGLDPTEVLRGFTRTWQFSVDVRWKGRENTIHLTSQGKRIRSQMGFDDAAHRTYWYGSGLGVEKSRRKAKAATPGAPASVLVDHPAFDRRRIVSVEPMGYPSICDPGSFFATLDETLLHFDAETGTFDADGE
jgi:hypothetical protein